MQTTVTANDGRLIGCARVSTVDQNLDLQMDAPRSAGCREIYTDKVSGSRSSRPGLDRCLERLETGDTRLVWRLDRLGRSPRHLLETVGALAERGVSFCERRLLVGVPPILGSERETGHLWVARLS